MSPARFLRPSRRGAACSALCFCLLHAAACGELGAGAGQGAGVAGAGIEDAGGEDAGTGQAAPGETAASPDAVSPDLVPAPAIFEATGTARWDGRRTLQGVWVADPQASTARRVRIYNAATGAAADGALFARDAVLTGPSMLVSSDAARLLGLAPGEETELRVVAVTARATAGREVAAATPSASPSGAAPAPARATGPARPTGARATARGRAAAPAPDKPFAQTTLAASDPGAAPKRTRAVQTVGETGREPTPGPRAAPLRPVPPAGMMAGAAVSGTAEGVARPAPTAPPQVDPVPAASTSPAAKSERAAASLPAAATAPAVDATPTAAPADDAALRPAAGALARPYVQAGLFAVAGNAERLIRRIEAEGLPALGKPVQLATGPATRVLAGPFATAAERDAARRSIQAMGLRDAIPVAR